MTQTVFRLTAWLIIAAIVVLSLIPPAVRPVTDTSHTLEHFAIFLFCGLAFGLGYSDRPIRLIAGLIGFSAAIEICQLWVPGRHARVSDFVIDVIAICIGAGIGNFVERLRKAQALRPHHLPAPRVDR